MQAAGVKSEKNLDNIHQLQEYCKKIEPPEEKQTAEGTKRNKGEIERGLDILYKIRADLTAEKQAAEDTKRNKGEIERGLDILYKIKAGLDALLASTRNIPNRPAAILAQKKLEIMINRGNQILRSPSISNQQCENFANYLQSEWSSSIGNGDKSMSDVIYKCSTQTYNAYYSTSYTREFDDLLNTANSSCYSFDRYLNQYDAPSTKRTRNIAQDPTSNPNFSSTAKNSNEASPTQNAQTETASFTHNNITPK